MPIGPPGKRCLTRRSYPEVAHPTGAPNAVRDVPDINLVAVPYAPHVPVANGRVFAQLDQSVRAVYTGRVSGPCICVPNPHLLARTSMERNTMTGRNTCDCASPHTFWRRPLYGWTVVAGM